MLKLLNQRSSRLFARLFSKIPESQPDASATSENKSDTGKSKVPYVLSPAAFEEMIYKHITNPNQYNGVPSKTLPSYTKYLKGLRPGEMTVFTGSTGCGKTTVLSQLSLDFATQGINTLWGSFEIRNYKLMKKMMHQYAGTQTLNEHNYLELKHEFRKIPMYFLDFFGSVPLETVMPVINEACDRMGIQHVIIDNLQFMLSGQDKGVGDKYDLMDKTVAALRKLCNDKGVHVTLVIHPRKEMDGNLLGISSIYGSAKATQEADNVIILQKDLENNRIFDIKKNRFDGEIGSFGLEYDSVSQLVTEREFRRKTKSYQKYPSRGSRQEGDEDELNKCY